MGGESGSVFSFRERHKSYPRFTFHDSEQQRHYRPRVERSVLGRNIFFVESVTNTKRCESYGQIFRPCPDEGSFEQGLPTPPVSFDSKRQEGGLQLGGRHEAVIRSTWFYAPVDERHEGPDLRRVCWRVAPDMQDLLAVVDHVLIALSPGTK